jgi:pyruvate formate-lyase activating enzyme-like uncharacterized protein
MVCDSSCSFCLTLYCPPGRWATSAFGEDPETLADRYEQIGVTGVGFSGGEPLLEAARLFHLATALRTRLPELYLWVYTNGRRLSARLLERMAQAGIQELRFNMAATGYRDEAVTGMLRLAVDLLPAVSVEVPAIPEDAETLRAALPIWRRAGVRYLNLHELTYEAGSPSATLSGPRESCRMPDGHLCALHPGSADLAAEVMLDLAAQGSTMGVNFCSVRSKAAQLRRRRRMLSPYTLLARERLHEEDEAESACCFGDEEVEFVHPTDLEGLRARRPEWRAARLLRLLPPTPGGTETWTRLDILPPRSQAGTTENR